MTRLVAKLAASALALFFAPAVLPLAAQSAAEPASQLARIKDVDTVEGIRDNQLVGYGIVGGLHGTGDSQQTIFPYQTLISTLERMGINLPTGQLTSGFA